MNLPFTADQFFGVFARRHGAIWPAGIAACPLAAVALAFVVAGLLGTALPAAPAGAREAHRGAHRRTP